VIVGSALEGQLSLSVPTMSRWWVWRSSNAVVILASPNTRIVWRGDSHYGRVEAMESAEDDGLGASTADLGARYEVKRICVNSGGRLSLQKHFHRSEHWVVRGVAEVTVGEEVHLNSCTKMNQPI
jgi:mannose-6-phosphate isomerase-like protein (cupin superfamily)